MQLGMSIGSSLLFVRDAAHIKRIRQRLRGVNREHITFCMWRCTCKKHKIDVNGRQSKAPYFLYAVLHM
jgi:hypothetical protein